MKFSLASLIALALVSTTVMALQKSAPASAEGLTLEKRSIEGVIKVSGLSSRNCPREGCKLNHQYMEGDIVEISCYTQKDTTAVFGDLRWLYLDTATYIPYSNGNYVQFQTPVSQC